jgi:hypothetical protein
MTSHTKKGECCCRDWGKRNGAFMLNRDSESTWEDENVLEMDDGVGSTTM